MRAAPGYIDERGLAGLSMHKLRGLSMHKLGAELGVKAMSRYNHVADKNHLLDGVVDDVGTGRRPDPGRLAGGHEGPDPNNSSIRL